MNFYQNQIEMKFFWLQHSRKEDSQVFPEFETIFTMVNETFKQI